MLKGNCINPELMAALSYLGHGDQILIADGNYPLASETGDDCDLIYLGLRPGQPTTTDVLETILSVINVEAAGVMNPGTGEEPEIFAEFSKILGGMELGKIGRWDFYDKAQDKKVRVAISTGEKRTFANILVTVGVS